MFLLQYFFAFLILGSQTYGRHVENDFEEGAFKECSDTIWNKNEIQVFINSLRYIYSNYIEDIIASFTELNIKMSAEVEETRNPLYPLEYQIEQYSNLIKDIQPYINDMVMTLDANNLQELNKAYSHEFQMYQNLSSQLGDIQAKCDAACNSKSNDYIKMQKEDNDIYYCGSIDNLVAKIDKRFQNFIDSINDNVLRINANYEAGINLLKYVMGKAITEQLMNLVLNIQYLQNKLIYLLTFLYDVKVNEFHGIRYSVNYKLTELARHVEYVRQQPCNCYYDWWYDDYYGHRSSVRRNNDKRAAATSESDTDVDEVDKFIDESLKVFSDNIDIYVSNVVQRLDEMLNEDAITDYINQFKITKSLLEDKVTVEMQKVDDLKSMIPKNTLDQFFHIKFKYIFLSTTIDELLYNLFLKTLEY